MVKETFEVGKTYKNNNVAFKVIERKGKKVTIEYTESVFLAGKVFLQGERENKTVKVAEGNGYYTELLSWAWGYRRWFGVEVSAHWEEKKIAV